MSLVVRLLVAAFAAVGLSLISAPPAVATCTSSGGVTIVAEFRELGGGTAESCNPSGGGQVAARLITGAGMAITYAQRMPGFICRIAGVPTEDPCVNTSPESAYWGLYWTDGTSGKWTYSSLGVTALKIPAGGSVGLAWQGSGVRGAPTVAAPLGQAPKPTPSPSTRPSPTKSPQPSAPPPAATSTLPVSSSAPVQTTPSAASTTPLPTTTATSKSAKVKPSNTESAKTKEPASSASTETTAPQQQAQPPTDASQPSEGDSLPLPLILLVLGLLGGGALGATVLRNRRT